MVYNREVMLHFYAPSLFAFVSMSHPLPVRSTCILWFLLYIYSLHLLKNLFKLHFHSIKSLHLLHHTSLNCHVFQFRIIIYLIDSSFRNKDISSSVIGQYTFFFHQTVNILAIQNSFQGVCHNIGIRPYRINFNGRDSVQSSTPVKTLMFTTSCPAFLRRSTNWYRDAVVTLVGHASRCCHHIDCHHIDSKDTRRQAITSIQNICNAAAIKTISN